ncbi:MAG: isoleucine--tRNA ligase [Acidobacteria bacterium]|nr:isoleucine--tRNA ligase [Acidobacteriota bacterium]
MRDLKDTLNLPRTDFPMKANLPTAEPAALARWEAMNLYAAIRARRATAPRFVLHDGPPYANGQIHIGHALNKIIKDFVVKSKTMAGFDAPYVPGWDCHGLPIELNVERELGPRRKELSTGDFRRACRDYATKFVASQRTDFERLGVFGDWDHPYLTMNYGYQAAIVRALGQFVDRGLVYKGKKPVHWCLRDRTALAEAEVEYETHRSPSIYVEFPLAEADTTLADRVPALAGRQVSVLIWTTTPWTIPANLAVAFHPDLDYGAYTYQDRVVIVATGLAERVGETTGKPLGAPLATFPGRLVESVTFRHPLFDRDSVAVLGDYVTLEQGTGAVHTAPGHGVDDFNTGTRYGLPITTPVGTHGRFEADTPIVGGLKVFEANPVVESALQERGRLWFRSDFEHSYPHCWRCHQPVIFLATPQWFIRMDDLRADATAAAQHTDWIPAWGRERMTGMFASRPDWCISRQRAWGVPIPAMTCLDCGRSHLTPALVERAAAIFERDNADAWYDRPLEEFLPDGFVCDACGSDRFERERDILDVWFDSGSSHQAVLAQRPELAWPADLYLEGTDQYRGWFQSSLLVGVGTRGRAPYNAVLTHGFVVDDHGRKMSKSIGNVISPQQIMKDSGADVLRLWVALVNFRDEIRLGKEVLARTVEAYRKVRNTCRYLLSNLYDFDPTHDRIAIDALVDVDRYTLSRYARLEQTMREGYEQYDFQALAHAAIEFVTVDLSALYLDVSKDRLYTFPATSPERRSAQTTLFIIADGLTRLLAPLMPMTADEIWSRLPGQREASVHLADFPHSPLAWQEADPQLHWEILIRVRREVNEKLELSRAKKTIGASLTAHVSVTVRDEETHRILKAKEADLPMIFIVSGVTLKLSPAQETALEVVITHAGGEKCPRCWRYVADLLPVLIKAVAEIDDDEQVSVCLRCAKCFEAARAS